MTLEFTCISPCRRGELFDENINVLPSFGGEVSPGNYKGTAYASAMRKELKRQTTGLSSAESYRCENGKARK